MPIIPLVLVNGASGIGTGWSTEIPQHNPEDIVENLIRMLNGEDPKPMDPWFFGFDGTVETSGNRIFSFCDVISFHSFFILSTTLILLFLFFQQHLFHSFFILSTTTKSNRSQEVQNHWSLQKNRGKHIGKLPPLEDNKFELFENK